MTGMFFRAKTAAEVSHHLQLTSLFLFAGYFRSQKDSEDNNYSAVGYYYITVDNNNR